MMRSLMQLLVRLPRGLRQKVPVTQLGTLIILHILRTMRMRTYIEDEMRFKIVKIILLDGIEWHKGQTFGLFLECSTHFGLAVDRMYTGQLSEILTGRGTLFGGNRCLWYLDASGLQLNLVPEAEI